MAQELASYFANFQRRLDLSSEPLESKDRDYLALSVDLRAILLGLKYRTLVVFVGAQTLQDGSHKSMAKLERFLLHAAEIYRELSKLVIFVLCPPGQKRRASDSLKGELALMGQPILEWERVADIKNLGDLALQAARRAAPRYVSPYQIERPVDERMLFGRDEIVTQLQTSRHHHVVVGARRIGKTSVVSAVKRQVRSAGRSVVYIDMADLGHSGWRNLWHALLVALGHTVKSYQVMAREPKIGRKGSQVDYTVDESKALRAVLARENLSPLIILDEVESWLQEDAKTGWKQLEQLRSIADTGQARLLLVGYETLSLAFSHNGFPLNGRARRIILGPIDREAMKKLVITPIAQLGIALEPCDQLLATLWQDSSGLPHLIQDICGELVSLALVPDSDRSSVGFPEYESALARSSAFESFETGLKSLDFPLAEAIAGVTAYAFGGGEREALPLAGSRPTNSYRIKEIRHLLSERDARLNAPLDELKLAFEYLRIRQILQPVDRPAARWKWSNQRVMRGMAKWIAGVGLEDWAKELADKHHKGKWRKKYSPGSGE